MVPDPAERHAAPRAGTYADGVPDYRRYTARDYGTRVGVYRMLNAFEGPRDGDLRDQRGDGLPYRIGAFEGLVADLVARSDAWVATGGDIVDAWSANASSRR